MPTSRDYSRDYYGDNKWLINRAYPESLHHIKREPLPPEQPMQVPVTVWKNHQVFLAAGLPVLPLEAESRYRRRKPLGRQLPLKQWTSKNPGCPCCGGKSNDHFANQSEQHHEPKT